MKFKAPSVKAQLREIEKQNPQKVVCAYCGKVLTEGVEPVSHGICEPCYEKAIKEIDNDADELRRKAK